jgi:hypothetical protein
MTVTDDERYAIAMAKLSQARSAVYEATRIIEHLFESGSSAVLCEIPSQPPADRSFGAGDPITGLYPGQKPSLPVEAEDSEECLE